MSVCPQCGKPIPKNKSFCSPECEQKQLSKEEPKFSVNHPTFLTQFDKGTGGNRRDNNIQVVYGMLKKGMSEQEIVKAGIRYFTKSKIYEYIEAARLLLEES